jgi:hypothetical protein
VLFLTTVMNSPVSNSSSYFKEWNTRHEMMIMAPDALAITEPIYVQRNINEFSHF